MSTEAEINAAVVRIRAGAVRATGFFVTPRHVVTAMHVIAGNDSVEILRDDLGEPVRAKVVEGASDREDDYAVLEVEVESRSWLPVVELHPDAATTHRPMPFRARGYPHGSEQCSLTGNVSRVDEGTLVCYADQLAAHTEEIATGFSGGPIVIDGGVAGIVRDCLQRDGGTLGGSIRACSIVRVVKNSICAEILRSHDLEIQRERVSKEIQGILAGSNDLLDELVSLVASGASHAATAVAEELVTSPVNRVTAVLGRAASRLGRGAARDVREILCHLLPLSPEYWPSVEKLRRELLPGGRADLHGATYAYAELVMAGVDRRPCAFVLRPVGLCGIGMVPLSPEEGMDIQGDRFVDAVIEYLAKELYVQKSARAVEGALRSLVAAADPRYPPYFLALDLSVYRTHREKVDSLLVLLKSLRLVVLTGGDPEAEEETYNLHPIIRLYVEDRRDAAESS